MKKCLIPLIAVMIVFFIIINCNRVPSVSNVEKAWESTIGDEYVSVDKSKGGWCSKEDRAEYYDVYITKYLREFQYDLRNSNSINKPYFLDVSFKVSQQTNTNSPNSTAFTCEKSGEKRGFRSKEEALKFMNEEDFGTPSEFRVIFRYFYDKDKKSWIYKDEDFNGLALLMIFRNDKKSGVKVMRISG